MATSDDYLKLYMESLAAEGLDRHALGDVEADLIGRVGRLRIKRDRAIRDMEAADLLKNGRLAACEVLGVAPSTVYKMAHRWRRFSTAKRTA